MYDIPGETEEDKRLTAEFKLKNEGKLKNGGHYRFIPFPGTKFYNNEDLLTTNMNLRKKLRKG